MLTVLAGFVILLLAFTGTPPTPVMGYMFMALGMLEIYLNYVDWED